MEEWLAQLASTLGMDPLEPGDVDDLLEVARDVAHRVERKVTPLATFLLGASTQRRIVEGATRTDALEAAMSDLRSILPPEE